MILGIGTDLVDIRRIERLLERFGPRFLRFVCVESEIQQGKKYGTLKLQASFVAKRFAAKEAFVKACGLGFRQDITFLNICVTNDDKGKPLITLDKKLEHALKEKFGTEEFTVHLSLADEHPLAQAFVVIST
ncbi:MAG: holo-ACP synthase [Alphaproteobacteria bacterium]